MADIATDSEAGNAKPYSVSELAFALKRTIEAAFGFVRLRGELSKVTFHANGHVYLDLKDERASISGVIWKTQVRTLAVRPQTGLEVIVTGKITTYPGRSQYQIIIETMAPPGVGTSTEGVWGGGPPPAVSPLTPAVGHEPAPTLSASVSDRRAPPPTAAAEFAPPVFADLAANLADSERRLISCGARSIELRRTR